METRQSKRPTTDFSLFSDAWSTNPHGPNSLPPQTRQQAEGNLTQENFGGANTNFGNLTPEQYYYLTSLSQHRDGASGFAAAAAAAADTRQQQSGRLSPADSLEAINEAIREQTNRSIVNPRILTPDQSHLDLEKTLVGDNTNSTIQGTHSRSNDHDDTGNEQSISAIPVNDREFFDINNWSVDIERNELDNYVERQIKAGHINETHLQNYMSASLRHYVSSQIKARTPAPPVGSQTFPNTNFVAPTPKISSTQAPPKTGDVRRDLHITPEQVPQNADNAGRNGDQQRQSVQNKRSPGPTSSTPYYNVHQTPRRKVGFSDTYTTHNFLSQISAPDPNNGQPSGGSRPGKQHQNSAGTEFNPQSHVRLNPQAPNTRSNYWVGEPPSANLGSNPNTNSRFPVAKNGATAGLGLNPNADTRPPGDSGGNGGGLNSQTTNGNVRFADVGYISKVVREVLSQTTNNTQMDSQGNTYNITVSDSNKSQMPVSLKDTGLYKFSGQRERYSDFKDLFIASTEHLPEALRLLTLRQYLDDTSREYVAYINVDDPSAFETTWKDLDDLHGHDPNKPDFHLTKLLSALTRTPCEDLSDLIKFYSFLYGHYNKACRGGPAYAAQAEAVKHGISSRLYGWSRYKVNDLKTENDGRDFNMTNILDKIKKHIKKEQSDNFSKNVAPTITNQGTHHQNGPPSHNQYNQSQHNQYNQSHYNQYGQPPTHYNQYNQSPSSQKSSSYRQYNQSPSREYYNNPYKQTSEYRPQSPSHYQKGSSGRQSRSRQRTPSQGSSYNQQANPNQNRGSYEHAFKIHISSDNQNDIQIRSENQNGNSHQASTDQNGDFSQSYHDSDHGSHEQAFKIHVNPDNQNGNSETKHKSVHNRSPTPFGLRRGGRSPSPHNSKVYYKCIFCKNSEHFSLNCNAVGSDDALRQARNDRLCFVCLMPFHNGETCPHPYSCSDAKCQTTSRPRHAPLLCQALNRS